MPTPEKQITVTIEGPAGRQKSLIADIIQEVLLAHGCPVTPDPSHGQVVPPAHRCAVVPNWDAEGVVIVERASGDA